MFFTWLIEKIESRLTNLVVIHFKEKQKKKDALCLYMLFAYYGQNILHYEVKEISPFIVFLFNQG